MGKRWVGIAGWRLSLSLFATASVTLEAVWFPPYAAGVLVLSLWPSGVDAEDPAGEGGYGSRYGVGSYGLDSAWGLEDSIAESKASCASN